jgi:replicative DNA helicase
MPVYFDPRESPNMAQIRASCKQQAATGLDLVVVDYLQRCTVDQKVDRWLAVGDLAKGLKSLARYLKVPVLAACQLNADAEEKRPTMAMLGQAQSIISAEADLVGLLHPQDMANWKTQAFPLVDLYVDKHRAGACMAIQLSFEKRSTKFVSVARGPS